MLAFDGSERKYFLLVTGLFEFPVCARHFPGAVHFLHKMALPKEVEHWSLTTLREKLVKIGAKVVSHGRYVTFQLAEVAVPRSLFLAYPVSTLTHYI